MRKGVSLLYYTRMYKEVFTMRSKKKLLTTNFVFVMLCSGLMSANTPVFAMNTVQKPALHHWVDQSSSDFVQYIDRRLQHAYQLQVSLNQDSVKGMTTQTFSNKKAVEIVAQKLDHVMYQSATPNDPLLQENITWHSSNWISATIFSTSFDLYLHHRVVGSGYYAENIVEENHRTLEDFVLSFSCFGKNPTNSYTVHVLGKAKINLQNTKNFKIYLGKHESKLN